MSLVTRLIVSCVFRRSERSASLSFTSSGDGMPSPPIVSHSESTRRHTRERNRTLPSSPVSVHSISFSGGATKRTYSRSASTPYFRIMSSGSTTFPFDLDITWPFFSTIPCVSSRANGSDSVVRPRSRKTRQKNRE